MGKLIFSFISMNWRIIQWGLRHRDTAMSTLSCSKADKKYGPVLSLIIHPADNKAPIDTNLCEALTNSREDIIWMTMKKARNNAGFQNKYLTVSYSHMANATLPSALQRFTSVFGMDTGGSIALWPSNKTF